MLKKYSKDVNRYESSLHQRIVFSWHVLLLLALEKHELE